MRAFCLCLGVVIYVALSGSSYANSTASCKQFSPTSKNEDVQQALFLQTTLEITNVTDTLKVSHGGGVRVLSEPPKVTRLVADVVSSTRAYVISLAGTEVLAGRAGASTVLVTVVLVVCALLFLSLLLSFAADAKDTSGSPVDGYGGRLLSPPRGGKAAGKAEIQASAAPSVRALQPRGSQGASFKEPEGRAPYKGSAAPRTSLPPTAGKTTRFSAPPICPSLILPETEARFVIALESLQQLRTGLGIIDISGQSGNKLLQGAVEDHIDGRRLSIASARCENDPRAVVLCRQDHYELFGRKVRDGTVCLRFYGPMEYVGSRLLLSVAPEWQDEDPSRSTGEPSPVLCIDPDARGELYLAATNLNGDRLATVDEWKMSNGKVGWRLIVKPGVDAILVLACMLSQLLLPALASGATATPSLPSASPRLSFVGTASSSRLLPRGL